MKRILLSLCILFFPLIIFSQDKISYEKVIQAEGISQISIYSGVKQWIALTYKSSKTVIEVDDKELGLIILNATKSYSYPKFSYLAFDGYLNYTIKFQIKDNRFKVELTNFIHESSSDIRKEYWSIGLIPSEKFNRGKNIEINMFNNVWLDLKSKSELLSNDILSKISEIKFNSENDNW